MKLRSEINTCIQYTTHIYAILYLFLYIINYHIAYPYTCPVHPVISFFFFFFYKSKTVSKNHVPVAHRARFTTILINRQSARTIVGCTSTVNINHRMNECRSQSMRSMKHPPPLFLCVTLNTYKLENDNKCIK